MREASSPSFFNPHEVILVKKYVQALREDQRLRLRTFCLPQSDSCMCTKTLILEDSQIGIISPYNAQNGKIRKAVNAAALKRNRPGILKVGSVEEFQGQVCFTHLC